jgi:hypothetical protein
VREEFYDIYKELYEIYRVSQYERGYFPPPYRRLMSPRFDILAFRRIEDAITDTLGELRLVRQLRPDARLFLLLNIHQMVALPLSYEVTPESESNLDSALREDLSTILQAASEESKEGEISGHNVINAISRTWEKLQISKLEIWG